MSGDQGEILLLTSEIPGRGGEKGNTSQKYSRTITVIANGLEIKSSLNPNASEFYPSHLPKNQPEIILVEKLPFVGNRNEATNQNETNVQQQLPVKETEEITDKIKKCVYFESSLIVRDCKMISETSENPRIIDEERSHENTRFDNKSELDVEINEVHVLFSNPCEVKKTSSDNSSSSSPVGLSECEMPLLDKKKRIDNAQKQYDDNNNIDDKFELTQIEKSSQDIPEVNDVENLVLDQIETKENNQDCNPTLTHAKKCANEAEIVYLFCKKNDTGTENRNKSKEAKIDISTPKDLQLVSGDAKPCKNRLYANSKIARVPIRAIGTIAKTSSSEPFCQNSENSEKEIKRKTGTTLTQNSNVAKNPKSKLATKTHISSKYDSTITHSLKKEVSKSIHKEALSNRSTTSTETSSPCTKSFKQHNKVTFEENSMRQLSKTKGGHPKASTATASSRLRKHEIKK